jgi:hypothetical protein
VIRIALMVAGCALLALAATLNDRAPRSDALNDFELQYFPSGRMLGTAALGFDAVASDFSFLRAVQYYGEHRRTDRQYPWAHHLFDVVTQLDSRYVTPYLFGGLVLAEDTGRLDRAVTLLERGMDAVPDRWELPFEAGFLILVRGRDAAGAAPWLERATRLPGSPDYVRRFAAYAHTRGGSREMALALWREIAATAEEPGLQEAARRYIAELEGTEHDG